MIDNSFCYKEIIYKVYECYYPLGEAEIIADHKFCEFTYFTGIKARLYNTYLLTNVTYHTLKMYFYYFWFLTYIHNSITMYQERAEKFQRKSRNGAKNML